MPSVSAPSSYSVIRRLLVSENVRGQPVYWLSLSSRVTIVRPAETMTLNSVFMPILVAESPEAPFCPVKEIESCWFDVLTLIFQNPLDLFAAAKLCSYI